MRCIFFGWFPPGKETPCSGDACMGTVRGQPKQAHEISFWVAVDSSAMCASRDPSVQPEQQLVEPLEYGGVSQN